MSQPIIPVILSGGAGTRLWPLSTAEHPKQFMNLAGDESLFARTLARVRNREIFNTPYIVGSGDHAALMEAELLGELWSDVQILLEPVARNTAPAIALAAIAISDHHSSDTLMLVMPSDHLISDLPAFHRAVQQAVPAALQGWLVTFGIEPERAETGYGYIASGKALEGHEHPIYSVSRFVEKPAQQDAETMIANGGHYWNAGIFLMRCDRYLEELKNFAPDMRTACSYALHKARIEGRLLHVDEHEFARSPANSVDYAIMEKAEKIAVKPVDCGWSDVGSWDALAEILPGDAQGNNILGHVQASECTNCLIRGQPLHVAAHGLDNLIIIATRDNVLIMPRGTSQQVKQIVADQKSRKNRTEKA